MPLEVAGKALLVDDEGYLIDPAQWNEQVAEKLARRERIVLSDEHWTVIRFMREYYELSLRLRQAGLQDRRHAPAAGLEHRLTP